MVELRKYSFVVLQYRHDSFSDERVNLAVLFVCPDVRHVSFLAARKFSRMTAMFPSVDWRAVKYSLSDVRNAVKRSYPRSSIGSLFDRASDAKAMTRALFQSEETAFIWGPSGSGVTPDHKATASRLLERYVTRYEQDSTKLKTDAYLAKKIYDSFSKKGIFRDLQAVSIEGNIDRVDFKFAWKNGKWNCIQPLSFDLATIDGIKDKARRWAGNLLAVQDEAESFRAFFVVSPPTNEEYAGEYQKAIKILESGPVVPEIFTEDRTDDLADRFGELMLEHQPNAIAAKRVVARRS